MTIFFLTAFLTWLLVTWGIARFVLSGKDHSNYDTSVEQAASQLFDEHADDQAANQRILQTIRAVRKKALSSGSPFKAFRIVREFADSLSDDLESDCTFTDVSVGAVSCEWIVAPGVDTRRRVLFHHGGAFVLGSPKGHRRFGHALSHAAKAAVLSVNYRKLPEHARFKGIKDAQLAYQHILKNGPDGAAEANFLLLAGDSAGGNLAMMLSAWSRDEGLRKPNGVIGFSPSLDMTARSPTMQANLKTDPILGQGIGLALSIPYMFAAWLTLFAIRMNAANKQASPLFNSLEGLPKTLIQASTSEVLVGESVRYVNKAREAGSDVTFQVWRNQLHDWQLFNYGYGSANLAWQEVEKFIRSL
ncbi:MAG: alpha/beta hydrolase [Pseudomonadota bacterium]